MENIALLLIVFTILGAGIFSFLNGIDLNSQECSTSKYNIYTNVTGGYRIFGSCYVPFYGVYEKTEKCGFLGISCYETKPYTQMYKGSICFKLKDGKLC